MTAQLDAPTDVVQFALAQRPAGATQPAPCARVFEVRP
jgi:hypothetical protein